MDPQERPDGRILIPVRVSENGIVGDGWLEIGPEHAQYAAWKAELEKLRDRSSAGEPA